MYIYTQYYIMRIYIYKHVLNEYTFIYTYLCMCIYI